MKLQQSRWNSNETLAIQSAFTEKKSQKLFLLKQSFNFKEKFAELQYFEKLLSHKQLGPSHLISSLIFLKRGKFWERHLDYLHTLLWIPASYWHCPSGRGATSGAVCWRWDQGLWCLSSWKYKQKHVNSVYTSRNLVFHQNTGHLLLCKSKSRQNNATMIKTNPKTKHCPESWQIFQDRWTSQCTPDYYL